MPYTQIIEMPTTGETLVTCRSCILNVPMKNSTLHQSMSDSDRNRQTFLPSTGRCLTSVSTPRWPFSRMAIMAPM